MLGVIKNHQYFYYMKHSYMNYMVISFQLNMADVWKYQTRCVPLSFNVGWVSCISISRFANINFNRLASGNNYSKPLCLIGNTVVSCRYFLQWIQWHTEDIMFVHSNHDFGHVWESLDQPKMVIFKRPTIA